MAWLLAKFSRKKNLVQTSRMLYKNPLRIHSTTIFFLFFFALKSEESESMPPQKSVHILKKHQGPRHRNLRLNI